MLVAGLYADPADEQKLRRMHETKPLAPDAEWYQGIPTGTAVGVKHAWDIGASALADVGTPILEALAPDSIDEWLRGQREKAHQSLSMTRPDPKTMGMLGQVAHGFSSVATQVVAGGVVGGLPGAVAAAGTATGYDKWRELQEQGVSSSDAITPALISGGTMALGVALPPFMGTRLLQQMASGAAINVGLGVMERSGIRASLEESYPEVAKHYKALDETAMLTEAVIGAAIPWGARLLKRPKVEPTTGELDSALQGRRGVSEQVRDPALQATLEGIDRKLAADQAFTAQILEGKTADEVVLPSKLFDETVENPELAKLTGAATRAIDELAQTEGTTLKSVSEEIDSMASAFREADVEIAARVAVEPVEAVAPKVGAEARIDVDPWITPKTFEEKLYEFKNALLDLQQQFGWAEVGGKMIRQQEAGDLGLGTGEVLGRTQWLPKADWWPGKPKSLTEKTGNDLVQKVLEGKTLTKADKANLEFLVGIMREQKKQKALGIEGKNDGVRPDAELEAGMVERLAKIDEGLVESLATRFEDTDAFMKEVKKALDEFDAKQEEFKLTGQTEAEIRAAEATRVRLEKEAKAKAAAPSPDTFMLTGSNRAADVGAAAGQRDIFGIAPDSFTRVEAQQIAASNPEMKVADSNGVEVSAKQMLEDADTVFKQETQETNLYKVAVACAIGVGE